MKAILLKDGFDLMPELLTEFIKKIHNLQRFDVLRTKQH